MKLSQIAKAYGQMMLGQHLEGRQAQRERVHLERLEDLPKDVFETCGPEILQAVIGMLEEREANEIDGKAKFIAHVAADMLRGNEGEIDADDVTRTVELAALLCERSTLAAAKPMRRNGGEG